MTDKPTKAKGETTHPDWTGAAAPGSAPGHAALPNALRIGRYAIVRVLGEGGMGTVYEAQQESPKRTVALKVIRAGYLSPELLRRFTQESQVLGRLQHPGIAQVYEAGMAKDERGHELPFFAMEFIKGVPLTKYVTQKKLGTRDRLELVAKVCDAVYHAHQKGVIHRDLKPGNIIVDESGQPKILDFGIAHATDSDIQQTTLQTDIGQLIGTIPYMSPEQVSGDPNDLDTRSDVYALGVIAYEILAGRLPYDLQRKMIHEAARIIREEDPTRLSSINRTLRGDVETIVAKALEKDKLRRYQSAESFASDIRRYLKHEPITARPASTWYQAARFARRNRGLVAGLAAAFLLLVAGLVGTSYGLRQAVASRNAEALQRKTAEVQRDKAEKIAEFMSDTLKGAGPSVARGRDITMLKEMMDAAAARIENGDLKDAPEAELRLRATIGIAYRELAVYDAAQRMLEPAVSLARSTHAADDLTTAEAVANLGRLLQVRGDLARAEPLYRESLEMKKRLFPGDHPDVATGLNNLGDLLRARGDLAGAEPPLRKALEMYQRLFPGDHPNVAIGLGNLANLLQARGDLAGAEPLCRESLEMTKRLFSGDHPNVATGLNNLAGLLHARGDLAGAEPLFEQALQMQRRLFPGDSPEVATGLNNLALMYRARGDTAGAETLCRESLEMTRRLFSGDHPDVAHGLRSLARLLQDRGDLAGAESLCRESLEMMKRFFRSDHPDVAAGLNTLASLLRSRGDLAGAEPLCRESLEMRKRLFPGDHPDVASGLKSLASLLYTRGDLAGAEPLFEQALQMQRRLFPGDSPEVATGLNNLALMYRARGDTAGAETLCRESLEMKRRLFQGDHPAVAASLSNLANILGDRGDLAGAEPLCRQSLEMYQHLFPGDHPSVATGLNNLAALLQQRGDLTGAEPLIREAMEMRKRVLGDEHPDTLLSLYNLADLLIKSGRYAEAAPLVEECIEERTKKFGAAHKETRDALGQAVTLYESWDKAEPGKGYDAKAAEWRARLDALTPPALDSTPPAG